LLIIFFEENENKFYIKFEWNNNIRIQIKEKINKENYIDEIDKKIWNLMKSIKRSRKSDLIFFIEWMRKRIFKKLNKIIKRYSWYLKKLYGKQGMFKNLTKILICLKCKGSLSFNDNKCLFCKKCDKKYKLNDVIPVMIYKE